MIGDLGGELLPRQALGLDRIELDAVPSRIGHAPRPLPLFLPLVVIDRVGFTQVGFCAGGRAGGEGLGVHGGGVVEEEAADFGVVEGRGVDAAGFGGEEGWGSGGGE